MKKLFLSCGLVGAGLIATTSAQIQKGNMLVGESIYRLKYQHL